MARVNEFTAMADIILVMEDTKSLRGRSFSITGHLGRKRDDIIQIIETAGGRFDKAPNWSTNYLITNLDWTAQESSTKLNKAKQNGTRIISEKQFYEMLMPEVADG